MYMYITLSHSHLSEQNYMYNHKGRHLDQETLNHFGSYFSSPIELLVITTMAQVTNRIFQVPMPMKTAVDSFPHFITRNDQWVDMEGDEQEVCDSVSTTSSSSFEDSNISSSSSSSSELTEDASSSLSSCSSFESSVTQFEVSNKGPLYELSELMNQLPIKRGLSKHFQGKSQSFTSLSNVQSLEDLAKKEVPFRKKMKPCKSYAGGLDAQKSFSPKTCSKIKKASKGTSFSSFLPSGGGGGGGVKKNGFISGSHSRPPICVQKNF